MSVFIWILAACGGETAAPVAAAPGTAPDATAAAATAPAAPAAAAPATRDVDVAALKAALDGGAVKLLVDVRTPGEYAGGHVAGAKNIPLDELDARLAELGPPGEVHLICQSGARSARAAKVLAGKGYAAVNVTGGTGAWKAAGFAVE